MVTYNYVRDVSACDITIIIIWFGWYMRNVVLFDLDAT